MEKDIIKEGQEELKRSLLVMNYDMRKTLSENTEVIIEQNNEKYFETRIKQILKYPEKISVFKPSIGQTQIKAAQVINQGVSGLRNADKSEAVNYSIDKGFNTLEELLGLSKKYKESYGESLLDALEGEWFAGGDDRVIEKGVRLAKEVCNQPRRYGSNMDGEKRYKEWCTPVSDNELKYRF